MQFRVKDYDEAVHEMWMALTLHQPEADYLCKPVFQRGNGEWVASQRSVVMDCDTNYRGEVLICSRPGRESDVHPTGVTCGLVELYDVQPHDLPGCWEWKFRNPRRVIPFPAKTPRGKAGGLWRYVCPKGEVTEYPRLVRLGE